MANPFPGMDPYLEGSLWTSVHHSLINELTRQVAPKIRAKYFVWAVEREIVASPYPTELEHSEFKFIPPAPVPHVSFEIRELSERRRVTVIEVLTPTNKRGEGAAEYSARRRHVLNSKANLVEIDLIRVGERFPVGTEWPSAPYFVFVSRASSRPAVEALPIPLASGLPVIPVPLLAGDADVAVDLHKAMTTIHDLFGYDRMLNYSVPPPGPFSAEDLAWMDQRLRAAGRR